MVTPARSTPEGDAKMRFNTPSEGINKTVNYEGDLAYKLDPALELYVATCCASLQPKFYVPDVDGQLQRLRGLIEQNNHEYVAKLAVYAREQMYLRSVPLVLAVELARVHHGDDLVRRLTTRVIQRADELTEILAYYQAANKRTDQKKLGRLSNQLKKGVADAFHKFDEHRLQKYNRDSEIKLRDALFLTHPKPRDDAEAALFKKIADGTLETPFTWETQISAVGTQHFDTPEAKAAAFKAKWEELIDSGKISYMATLRNIRNCLDARVSLEHITKLSSKLSNPDEVRHSKQLPFRFLSAYRELEGHTNPHTPIILNALEDAVLVAAENIAGYDYNTSILIACDVSGSMNHPISPRSKVENYDIGLVLAMLLQNRCKTYITGVFGDVFKTVALPNKAILQNTRQLARLSRLVGWSTNGWTVPQYLLDNKVKIDKVMIFTDCQMWDSSGHYQGRGARKEVWHKYKQFNPAAKLYLFDLMGYGHTPLDVRSGEAHLIAGWSDKIFTVLAAIEQGKTAQDVVNTIEL